MLQKVPQVVGAERELLENRESPAGVSQWTYRYEHCYYHFEKKTTLIWEKQLCVDDSCVKT